jgi:hypothetical protein
LILPNYQSLSCCISIYRSSFSFPHFQLSSCFIVFITPLYDDSRKLSSVIFTLNIAHSSRDVPVCIWTCDLNLLDCTNSRAQILHLYGLCWAWVNMWSFKFPLRLNPLEHILHWYGLLPLWMIWWRVKLLDLVNVMSHWGHLNGFSPRNKGIVWNIFLSILCLDMNLQKYMFPEMSVISCTKHNVKTLTVKTLIYIKFCTWED